MKVNNATVKNAGLEGIKGDSRRDIAEVQKMRRTDPFRYRLVGKPRALRRANRRPIVRRFFSAVHFFTVRFP